jgi:hypothetical protein
MQNGMELYDVLSSDTPFIRAALNWPATGSSD